MSNTTTATTIGSAMVLPQLHHYHSNVARRSRSSHTSEKSKPPAIDHTKDPGLLNPLKRREGCGTLQQFEAARPPQQEMKSH